MTQDSKPATAKPLPRPEAKGLTAPFWEAAKRNELIMQRCRACDSRYCPARGFSPFFLRGRVRRVTDRRAPPG